MNKPKPMKMIKTLTSLSSLGPVDGEKGEKMKPFKLPQVISREPLGGTRGPTAKLILDTGTLTILPKYK